jgi:hypothetical protein
MIQTDENGREFKICARQACGQQFERRSNESDAKFTMRDYCCAKCRIKENRQPAPAKRQSDLEVAGGFVNPEGVWRPGGFPVYPGGIEVA